MSHLKTFITTVLGGAIGTVIGGLILANLNFIKEQIWMIIFYAINLSIGALIGFKFFEILKFLIRIIRTFFKWVGLIFTIGRLDTKINKLTQEKEKLEKSVNKIRKNLALTNLIIAASYFREDDFSTHYLENYCDIFKDNDFELDKDMLDGINALSEFIDEYMKKNIAFQEIDFLLVFLEKLLHKSKETKKEIHLEKLNEIFTKLYHRYGEDEINAAIKKRKKETES